MQLSSFFALFSTGLALAAAQTTPDTTSTMTKTLTRTRTITRCNPTVTNCPGGGASASVLVTTMSLPISASHLPIANTTTAPLTIIGTAVYSNFNRSSYLYPTGSIKNNASASFPTCNAGASSTRPIAVTFSAGATLSPQISTAGADDLIVRSGLLLYAVGAAGLALFA